MLEPLTLLSSLCFLSFIFLIINNKYQVYFLLIISLILYGLINIKFLLVLLFIILVTYFGSLFLKNNKVKNNKTDILIIILLIIFPLIFYKYLFNLLNALSFLNANIYKPLITNELIIPIGLSFYTFQSIAYIIDVSKNKSLIEKNIFKLATFISFFPQILAGPIERWSKLSKQLFSEKKPNPEIILNGITILLYGLFLKIVISERLAVFVDMIFSNYIYYNSFSNFLGLVCFFFQIFCDFAGYSLIAMGVAKFFGINLSLNFKQPFFATSLSDFWQRWHITLTKWVGDYVYKPMAIYLIKNNYNLKFTEYFSLLITWLVIGIWHGSTVNYAVFGFLQFALIAIFGILKKNISISPNIFINFFNNIITLIIVILTFGLIRSDDFEHYQGILLSLFNYKGILVFPSGKIELLIGFIVMIFIEFLLYKNLLFNNYMIKYKYNTFIRSLILICFVIFIYLLGYDEISAFIYFKY